MSLRCLILILYMSLICISKIESQAISNIRHYYTGGAFDASNISHYYNGEFTYSFFNVKADTFYYEDQLVLPLKNKDANWILLKLNKDGKAVKHAIFRSQLLTNGNGSKNITGIKSMAFRNGEIYLTMRAGGYLEMNGAKIEGNYDHSSPLVTRYVNNVVLGLDENFNLIFQKFFESSLTLISDIAINGDVRYILGTFWWDSIVIEGQSISRAGSALLRKSYLNAYDLDQDTLLTKTCFAGGGTSNQLGPMVFDKQGNFYIALIHDSERLFLDEVYVAGNFGGANGLIIKLNPSGKVIDYFSTIVPNKNCYIRHLILNQYDEIMVFGRALEYTEDSLAYIGQNGNSPINTNKNWATFMFKLNENMETEWYNLWGTDTGHMSSFDKAFIDEEDNIYFTLYNEKGFEIKDLQGNIYGKGNNICKIDQAGNILYHNNVGELLTYFHDMKLKSENILTVNAVLLNNPKEYETLFGKTFRSNRDGVIFDLDIREKITKLLTFY